MSEVLGVPGDTGSEARTDYDWVNKEVIAEALKQVQAMVAAQHGAITAVDAKLTTVLSIAVTLSSLAFGASTLPLAEDAWMPAWAGIGLCAAGLWAGGTAFAAWRGLRLRKWATPGLPFEDTALPSVLKAQPQTAMVFMASAYQTGVEENRKTANSLNSAFHLARTLFVTIPVFGLFAALAAWLWFHVPQLEAAMRI